jgi:uncharacterized protein
MAGMTPDPGLCATCRMARVIPGSRSQFWMCQRSVFDHAYPRYPNLPVVTCAGYEAMPRLDTSTQVAGAGGSTMPEITEYKPGTPIWIDLGTSDLASAVTFYTTLFGWEPQDMGPDFGHYTMMSLRGKSVCAVSPLMGPEQPVAWSTYLCTTDTDETVKKVKAAGGSVIAEPMEVSTSGKLAAYFDPTGAAILSWEPRDHPGAQLVNEPGTLVWNELMTHDKEKATAFYAAAFGLGTEPFGDYTMFTVDGRGVAGMMQIGGDMPKDMPSHWRAYFGVEDCDAMAKRVSELGGSVLVPPMDIPGVGRFAIVADGQGASFGIIKGETQPAA